MDTIVFAATFIVLSVIIIITGTVGRKYFLSNEKFKNSYTIILPNIFGGLISGFAITFIINIFEKQPEDFGLALLAIFAVTLILTVVASWALSRELRLDKSRVVSQKKKQN